MSEQNARYLEMSEAELDTLIGDALVSQAFGSKNVPDAEKRSVARNWFESNLEPLSQAVCKDDGVLNFLVGPNQKERNLLLGAIADAIMKAAGLGLGIVPVGALAAKVLHYGVDQLCDAPKPRTT